MSWGSGPKSLADDFSKQLTLSQTAGFEKVRLGLVVSDCIVRDELLRSVPQDLDLGKVCVEFFPWEEKALQLCNRWPKFLAPLSWLSKHENPGAQQIAEVLQILIGKWIGAGREGTTRNLLQAARDLSPALIRPLVSDDEAKAALRPELTKVLASVERFSYSIVKGFLAWTVSYPGGASTRAVCAHDCLSASFAALQERVIRTRPTTTDELERELS